PDCKTAKLKWHDKDERRHHECPPQIPAGFAVDPEPGNAPQYRTNGDQREGPSGVVGAEMLQRAAPSVPRPHPDLAQKIVLRKSRMFTVRRQINPQEHCTADHASGDEGSDPGSNNRAGLTKQ